MYGVSPENYFLAHFLHFCFKLDYSFNSILITPVAINVEDTNFARSVAAAKNVGALELHAVGPVVVDEYLEALPPGPYPRPSLP